MHETITGKAGKGEEHEIIISVVLLPVFLDSGLEI